MTSGREPAFGLVVRVVLVALLVLATAACGGYRFPGGTAGASGTVSGQVTTVPCGPVQPADKQQCSGRPGGGIEIDFSGDGGMVATRADSNGYYSVELASGTWKVSLKGYLRIISGPPAVTVSPGAHVVANYVVGPGILVPVPAG